jgi:flagellar basal-body rod protein FlgF
MADFLQAASDVLTSAQQRVEIAAQNISNTTTPGYRRRVAFEALVSPAVGPEMNLTVQTATDFTQGKQAGTSNPLDLAITGAGFFAVQDGSNTLYTRNGQFKRGDDGRLTTAQGLLVEAEGGGDLTVKDTQFQVQPDGTVLEDKDVIGKLALVDFANKALVVDNDKGLFSTAASNVVEAGNPQVRQGALESANVSTGDEMVSIMAALRGAEAGQRLVNVYDDLLGRVISTMGQG